MEAIRVNNSDVLVDQSVFARNSSPGQTFSADMGIFRLSANLFCEDISSSPASPPRSSEAMYLPNLVRSALSVMLTLLVVKIVTPTVSTICASKTPTVTV